MPPGPAAPTGANNNGATAGSLNSGAMGTLGTNVLQQDLDTLNRSVQELTTAVNNMAMNMQTGTTGQFGASTRQQGPANNNGGFPGMINASRLGATSSGGNGGWGSNISGMSSGGYASNRSMYSGNGGTGSGAMALAGAVAGYGAAQSQNLVGLNSYATQSLIGYDYNGQSQSQAMQQLYGQAGASPNKQISIGTGALSDNIQMAQTLQQVAGSQNIKATSLGRGALGAAYGFGITNPNLTAASAGQMGAGLYGQQFSYNLRSLGYGFSMRNGQGGANMNAGQGAMSILQKMNLGKATSQQVTAAFATGGAAQQNLNYLTSGTGITAPAMQQYLTDYAQLVNNKGLTSTAANSLMSQAASGSSSQMKSARAQLSKYGVSTANNDLASLTENAASSTGRAGDVASGFNSGLQQSAGLLTSFNNALNSILKGPLGTALGYGGGSLGTISGSALGSGSNMLGTAGSYMMIQKLMAKGGAGAAAGEGAEGAATAAAGGGTLAAGASVALPAIAALYGLNKIKTRGGGSLVKPTSSDLGIHGKWWDDLFGGGGSPGWLTNDLTGGRFETNKATMGGGAVPMASASSSQQTTGGKSQAASVSSAAKKAVSAAESQKGIPYRYGAETPGVGFDCSGLIQWAYKQAGIALPRTSQQMWSQLSKRAVSTDKVQEGDLVFTAGSDGSAGAPGHVGLMISDHQLIEAPRTGENVKIIGYDRGQWSHAARPAGSGSFIKGAQASVSGTAAGGTGNTGRSAGLGGGGSLAGGSSGNYGSVNEADVISAMGGGGQGGSSATTSMGGNGTSGSKNTVTGKSSGNTPATGGSIKVPAGSISAIAKKLAKKYGWDSGTQWDDFVKVENREAGWNLHAKNPTSTAYGLAQFIDGPSEYYKYGGNPNTAQGQLTAMFAYIKERYGSPAKAWSNEQSAGYYAAGGMTLPGLAVVGERGPELMMQGGGNQVFSNSQTMALINSIKGASPAQSPWKTDITSGGGGSSAAASHQVNVSFGTNSIIVNTSGNSTQAATQSAQEIQRQITKSLGHASIHQAIRSGDKL